MSFSPSSSRQLQLTGFSQPSPWEIRARRGEDPTSLAIQSVMNYAAERDREAVGHRGTMCKSDILAAARAFRAGVEAGDALSIIRMVAAILNIPTEAAPTIPLGTPTGFAAYLDPKRGCIEVNFRRSVSPRAAKPPRLGNTLPGTLLLNLPLPEFLASIIDSAHKRQPRARTLGELFRCVIPDGHMPIVETDMGRLRTTPVRLRRSLPIFLLDLGVDRYYVALVTCAFYLLPRARFYYALSEANKVSEARRLYYSSLGWGPAVAESTGRPFGSTVVPTDASLQRSFSAFAANLQATRPPKRWQLEGVIRYHNQYALAASWLFIACIGPRNMRKLRFEASSCVAGITHLELADKRVGGHELHLSTTVCSLARELIGNYWSHLRELCRRALEAGADPGTPWLMHLRKVLDRRPVSLFFLIEGEIAAEFGTKRVLAEIPKRDRGVPNWSRHYWQTSFLAAGVSTSEINVWARHMLVGDEPNSSTSIVVRAQVQRRISEVQDKVLRGLGFAAFRGLVYRGEK